MLSPLKVLAEESRYWSSLARWRLSNLDRRPPGLFVVGSPKTGTTWMRALLSDLPGAHYRGHYDSKERIGKMRPGDVFHSHVRARDSVIAAIEASGARAILVIRDLRDQAVSRAFHIRRQPFTVGQRQLANLPISEVLKASIIGWPKHDFHGVASSAAFSEEWISTGLALRVRFEDLVADSSTELNKICKWIGLDLPLHLVESITSRNRFERMSAGRRFWKARVPGKEDRSSLIRKGIVGDWRNYFTPEHVEIFKELAGGALINFGYESTQDWGV